MSSFVMQKARRGGYALLAIATLMATVLSTAAAQAETTSLSVPQDAVAGITADKIEATYIVQFADDPAAAYEGGIDGLSATKPGNGGKFNPNSQASRAYDRYLNGVHDDALRSVGVRPNAKVYDYTVSFNGVAASMTGTQALELAKRDDVVNVWKDEIRQLTTDYSEDYLDMPTAWSDPAIGGEGLAGEDVIVGIIDTGISANHPSFSDQTNLANAPAASANNNQAYSPVPEDWYGSCEQGEQFPHNTCNNKLIGARYFVDGFTKFEINFSGDYFSPADFDGHGTHVASTAAGNRVPTVLPNGDVTEMVGMAPRARVAAYKVCWADAGCAGSDLVAAIDQAVLDGVDVINYSIGSSAATVAGPDDVAFLFAADAGVFVATSNGNAGSDPNTTGSPSSDPWITSVGAGQHGRNFLGDVTLGDGATYSGASVNTTETAGVLVDSALAGSELCIPGELDASVVSGNIVLCARGAIARVDKSAAVAQAGGIGMIMYNPTGDSLNADTHAVPSIHVNHIDGAAIKTYVSTDASPMATISVGGTYGIVDPDVVAGFSSRGVGFSADIIKPDILAPGVNIWAAAPRHTFFGQNKDGGQFLSGTSMASPHIAGIGALMVQAHPDWSPAMIKSALMTTANPDGLLKEDVATPATPLDRGSGLVQPGSAFDPGLVYDAGLFEYAAWTCAAGAPVFSSGTCDFLSSLGFSDNPSDLNQPNIAIGALAGVETVIRTVTNVGPEATYHVSVDAPDGVSVTVDPEVITLAEGESASYHVTFEALPGSSADTWAFGSLAWTHGPHVVQSQLAIRPVVIAAPSEVAGEGTDGSLSFDVTFGADGDYEALPHGLVAATETAGTVVDDPANDINVALGTGVGITIHEIVVPDGSAYARFSLMDDFTDGADDLDLYVFTSGGAFVGGSGSGTSAEQVDIAFPAGDTYLVIVHGWQTDGPDSNYTLFSWAFAGDEGNMTVSGPAAAVLGTTATIDVSWTGLDPDMFYLGAVSHNSGGELLGLTLIHVDS